MANLPKGFTALTPMIIVKNAKETMELYEKALGMKILNVTPSPENPDSIMHSTLEINGAKLFLADECPEQGSFAHGPQGFYLYFDDIDAAYAQAIAAGMSSEMPPMDMFWGDRMARVKDKNGCSWALAKFVKEMTPEEMQNAMRNNAK